MFVSASNVLILHVSHFNMLRYHLGTVSRRTESPVVLFQLLDGLFLHNVHVKIFHVKKKIFISQFQAGKVVETYSNLLHKG